MRGELSCTYLVKESNMDNGRALPDVHVQLPQILFVNFKNLDIFPVDNIVMI